MNKYFNQTLLVISALLSTAFLSAQDLDMDAGSIQLVTVDDSKTTMEGKTFNGDYFYGGKGIDYSGTADDIYLMAKTVDFSGKTTGALYAFGRNVDISGVVEGNLHSAGKDLKISGHIEETAFLGAGNLLVSPDAVINGTLIASGRSIEISGLLNNGLIAGAGEIIIDAPVKGNVTVKVGKLIITERGSISGNLNYDSNKEISASEKARVSGNVKYEFIEEFGKDFVDDFGTKFTVIACLIVFVTMIISGLLLLLLPSVKTLFEKNRDGKELGKTSLWGLLPLLVYPIAVLVTIPLFPLSIALGLAAFPLLGLATVFGLALAGKFLFTLFKWENKNILLQYLLASGIYVALSFIPFVGCLIGLAVVALGSGLIIGKLFKTDF